MCSPAVGSWWSVRGGIGMDGQLKETLISNLSATRSSDWMHRVISLLESAVGQLHNQVHPAQGTLLEATSLLRRQIDPPIAREGPDEGDACWPGRRARCVSTLIVISQDRYSSRIFAHSFSAAKRTSREPSSAPSGSHRTVSSCDVAWNWPLDICLPPMRLSATSRCGAASPIRHTCASNSGMPRAKPRQLGGVHIGRAR